MKAFVALFTEKGRLIHYSGDRHLVRKVALELMRFLTVPQDDPDGEELTEARRRILKRIIAG